MEGRGAARATQIVGLLALAEASLATARTDPPKPADTIPPSSSAPAKPGDKAPPPVKRPSGTRTIEGVTVTGGSPGVEVSPDKKSYAAGKDLAARAGSITDLLKDLLSAEISRAVFIRLDSRFDGASGKAPKDPGFESENSQPPG